MEWKGAVAEFRITACRYGSGFLIHIHMGDGIGVGLFFGLFSVPVLTLVCRQQNMHTCSHKSEKGQHTHSLSRTQHEELEGHR